jgi:homoserine kinase
MGDKLDETSIGKQCHVVLPTKSRTLVLRGRSGVFTLAHRSMRQVTFRVPASTSNLGPGFDCLGVALRIYNFVTVARNQETDSPALLVREVARLFFHRARRKPFAFSCSVSGDVPKCRGLGGSATVRLGVLHGLNLLAGEPLNRQQVFELAAELEGHPDNAAPSEFGGFSVGPASGLQRFTVSSRLKFVLLIPDLEISTRDARRLLPTRIPHSEAVKSSAAASAVTAAMVSRNYENLRGAFVDYIHQPYRKKLLPFFDDVIRAGERAGALGGFLSGSGSTIINVTLLAPEKVAAAMLRASRLTSARTIVTTADNRGARIAPIRI